MIVVDCFALVRSGPFCLKENVLHFYVKQSVRIRLVRNSLLYRERQLCGERHRLGMLGFYGQDDDDDDDECV